MKTKRPKPDFRDSTPVERLPPPSKSSSKNLKTHVYRFRSRGGKQLQSLAELRCQVGTFTAAMQAGLFKKHTQRRSDRFFWGGGL